MGGMAEIFLAFERGTAGFERVVVIKRLRREFAEDQGFRDMFLKEARTIARLNHPNIVKVHELGEDAGTWYIAMEYVPGSSFRELMAASIEEASPLPFNVAIGLLVRACAGAHGAHELRDSAGEEVGLVHRDIAPDNLMVEASGHVKLLDFGIAKAVTRDESTRIGTLKGKIAYMSPEQCQQLSLDRRSDVFSLGIVGWELLAGRRLFKRDSEYASMQAIVNGELRVLREAREDCPEDLAAIIERALSMNPDDRFRSADDMRRELIELAARRHFDLTLDAIGPTVVELMGETQESRARELELAIVARLDGPDDLLLEDLWSEELGSEPESDGPSLPKSLWSRRGLVLACGIWLAAMVGLSVSWAPGEGENESVLGGALVIGIAPVMDQQLYLDAHEALRQHLQVALGRVVSFQSFGSYELLGDALVEGRILYASLPPFLYVRTQDRLDGLEVLATKLVDGSAGTDGVVLVRGDSDIQNLKDLSGLTICFTDRSSTTGWLLPRAALSHAGVHEPVQHFSGNHLQALRDLQAELCEAACTYSGGWLGGDRAGLPVGNLRVLALTGRSPQDAMVANPQVEPEQRELLRDALLSFEDPGAQGVERITGYTFGGDEVYDTLREASREEFR